MKVRDLEHSRQPAGGSAVGGRLFLMVQLVWASSSSCACLCFFWALWLICFFQATLSEPLLNSSAFLSLSPAVLIHIWHWGGRDLGSAQVQGQTEAALICSLSVLTSFPGGWSVLPPLRTSCCLTFLSTTFESWFLLPPWGFQGLSSDFKALF